MLMRLFLMTKALPFLILLHWATSPVASLTPYYINNTAPVSPDPNGTLANPFTDLTTALTYICSNATDPEVTLYLIPTPLWYTFIETGIPMLNFTATEILTITTYNYTHNSPSNEPLVCDSEPSLNTSSTNNLATILLQGIQTFFFNLTNFSIIGLNIVHNDSVTPVIPSEPVELGVELGNVAIQKICYYIYQIQLAFFAAEFDSSNLSFIVQNMVIWVYQYDELVAHKSLFKLESGGNSMMLITNVQLECPVFATMSLLNANVNYVQVSNVYGSCIPVNYFILNSETGVALFSDWNITGGEVPISNQMAYPVLIVTNQGNVTLSNFTYANFPNLNYTFNFAFSCNAVIMNNVSMQRLSVAGNQLFGIDANQIQITNSIFSGLTLIGQPLFSVTDSLLIENVTFDDINTTSTLMNLSSSAISILYNTSFSNIQIQRSLPSFGVISIQNTSPFLSMNISNSQFMNLQTDVVFEAQTQNFHSFLYIQIDDNSSLNTIFITNSAFANSMAAQGPAIQVYNTLQAFVIPSFLNITDCQFINNTALLQGGAIYVNGTLPNIMNTTFSNNTSQFGSGGAIFVTPANQLLEFLNSTGQFFIKNFTQSSNILFFNNSAFSYNNTVTETDANSNDIGGELLPLSVTNILTSAQTVQINGSLVIVNSSTYTLLNTSFMLSITDALDNNYNNIFDITTYDITLYMPGNNFIWSVCDSFTTEGCVVSNPSIYITGIANQPYAYIFTFNSTYTNIQSPLYSLYLGFCSIGELNISVTSSSYRCAPCPTGTYSFNSTDLACSPCPPLAQNCTSGWQIFVADDTWRSGIYSSNILKCRTDNVCIGGGLLTQCQEGYTGSLCQSCNNTSRYMRSKPDTCSECDSNMTRLIILNVGKYCVVVIFFMIYTASQYSSDLNDEQTRSVSIKAKIYTRLLITYIQIIQIAIGVLTQYISSIQAEINQLFSYVANPLSTISASNLCLLTFFGYYENLYYINLMMTVLFPFVLILTISVIRLVLWRFQLDEKRWLLIRQTALSVVLFEQLAVVSSLINFFNCTQLSGEQSEEYYIYTEMSYVCYNSTYNNALWLLGLPGLAFWGFLIPLIAFVKLFKIRNDEKISGVSVFTALTYGQRKSAYYWGLIFIILRVILIVCSTLLQSQPLLNGFCLLLLLYGYNILLNYVKPFVDKDVMMTERYTVKCFVVTIFFSLLPADAPNNSVMSIISVVVLTLVNGMMTGYLVYLAMGAYYNKYYKKVSNKVGKVWGRLFGKTQSGSENSEENSLNIDLIRSNKL